MGWAAGRGGTGAAKAVRPAGGGAAEGKRGEFTVEGTRVATTQKIVTCECTWERLRVAPKNMRGSARL